MSADFADIINRSPRTYKDTDLDTIISTLRNARSKFKLGNKSAGAPKELTGEKAELAKIDVEIKL